jgi:hypothetical protein
MALSARLRAALRSPDRFRRGRDFVYAALLFRLPAALRRRLFWGDRCFCPVCESPLRGFLVLHRAYHRWCPVCRSLQRHRLVWLLVQQRWAARLRPGSRLLHVAPEPALAARFAQFPGLCYLPVDLDDSRARVKLDVTALPFAGAAFDLIYCSHVLEHVADDRQALAELRRVLTGQMLLVVPITATVTNEEPGLSDPVERERRFGQHDHVRCYGLDFVERMAAAGCQVQILRCEDLATPAEIRRYGLTAGERLFLADPT